MPSYSTNSVPSKPASASRSSVASRSNFASLPSVRMSRVFSRLLFDMLQSFFSQAAGRSLRCAMVSDVLVMGTAAASDTSRQWYTEIRCSATIPLHAKRLSARIALLFGVGRGRKDSL